MVPRSREMAAPILPVLAGAGGISSGAWRGGIGTDVITRADIAKLQAVRVRVRARVS